MTSLQVDVEDDLLALLRQTNMSAPQAVRECVVLELYRRGTISSGKGAQLLGMPRWAFIQRASQVGIAFFDMAADEWQDERQRSESL